MGKHREAGKGWHNRLGWAAYRGLNKGREWDGRGGCDKGGSEGWGWARGLSKHWPPGRDRSWAGLCASGWNKGRGRDEEKASGRHWGWRGGLGWNPDLGIRRDPDQGWDRFGTRVEGGAGGQGQDWDRTRGRDKGWAMARGGGGAGQASAGRSQS